MPAPISRSQLFVVGRLAMVGDVAGGRTRPGRPPCGSVERAPACVLAHTFQLARDGTNAAVGHRLTRPMQGSRHSPRHRRVLTSKGVRFARVSLQVVEQAGIVGQSWAKSWERDFF